MNTYANESFDRGQQRAMARCAFLGHTHPGYCAESIEHAAKDWEITAAQVSGGMLHAQGINHCGSKVERFAWGLDHHSFPCDRYDWSGCVFGPGAKEKLEEITALGARLNPNRR